MNETQEYDTRWNRLLIMIQFIETNKKELKLVVEHIYCQEIEKKMQKKRCQFIFARICTLNLINGVMTFATNDMTLAFCDMTL